MLALKKIIGKGRSQLSKLDSTIPRKLLAKMVDRRGE
jgi:hypothetical protein